MAQARVIARALDDLPEDLPEEVPADVVALAESTLVGHCAEFGPRQLARLGRRILDVVAPEIADAAEARRLAALEAHAHRATRLTLRRVGDGTTRLSGLLPDHTATRLATYLEAFTNPRKADQSDTGQGSGVIPAATRWPAPLPPPPRAGVGPAPGSHRPAPAAPARRRRHHRAGDDRPGLLRHDLGVADLHGSHVPGNPETQSLGETLTAAQACRLACTAGIIPSGPRRRLPTPRPRPQPPPLQRSPTPRPAPA
ncbi:MAG: DUF222 domain-containing protein [Nocardioides sp.]